MSFNIYHSLYIKAPVNMVFDAISEPEHLNNWWTLTSSGKPKLDAVYNLNFTDEFNWFGVVSKCEYDKSFYIKMTDSDQDWNETTFGFDLKESENGVLVEFSHVNWPQLNHHFKYSSYCWAILLKALKNYLETGTVISFKDRN